MTRLALNMSEYINGVAKKHAEVSNAMFPGYKVHAITNGVHPFIWTSENFRQLYDHYLPGWCHEPQLLVRADCCIPDATIWEAHVQDKQHLIEKVQSITGVMLKPDIPILGFARRMTAYKRPDLLFTDLERLKTIARKQPFQIVLAGKAHPRDENGKHLIELLYAHARDLAGTVTVAYLPDYDMSLAQVMTAGVDVWLNTPLPPFEASGTSGMKAAFNGVPNLSVLDGWWVEGCIEGVTGWAIGDTHAGDDARDLDALHRTLRHDVLPAWKDRAHWLRMMQASIAMGSTRFSSDRMVREYHDKAYAGLAVASDELLRNKRWKLKMLVQENQRVRKGFGEVQILSAHVGELSGLHVGDPVEVRVEVNLGSLKPDDVRVELVLGHASGEAELTGRVAVPLAFVQTTGTNAHVFEGVKAMDRSGSFSYGIRVRARTDREYAGSLRDLVLWA